MKNIIKKNFFVILIAILANNFFTYDCVGTDLDIDTDMDFEDEKDHEISIAHTIPVSTDMLLENQKDQRDQKNKLVELEDDAADPSIECSIARRLSSILMKEGISLSEEALHALSSKIRNQTGVITDNHLTMLLRGLKNNKGQITKESTDSMLAHIDALLGNGAKNTENKLFKFGKNEENLSGSMNERIEKSLQSGETFQTKHSEGSTETTKDLIKKEEALNAHTHNSSTSVGAVVKQELSETAITAAQAGGSTSRMIIKNAAAATTGGVATGVYMKNGKKENGGDEKNKKTDELKSKDVEELEKIKKDLQAQKEMYDEIKKELEKAKEVPAVNNDKKENNDKKVNNDKKENNK